MANNKRFRFIIILAAAMMMWSVSSCTLFAPKEETDEDNTGETERYTQPTQEKIIHLPTATIEEQGPTQPAEAKLPATATPAAPTPTAIIEQSATSELTGTENCPIILIEGNPGPGNVTASYSQTWNEAINSLQSSQGAPLTMKVSDQIDELCAPDGMVHVYLGWQDSSRLNDHGEMTAADAVTLLQNNSGQAAIVIP